MNRRRFLLTAATTAPAMAGNAVRIGLIGSGSRGRYLIPFCREDPAARIAAVCDVYEPNLEAGLSAAGNQATAYRNYRELLNDRTIDAVIIATPDHWHTPMLLDALKAGKDIYIEKPLCNTPEEGVRIMDAVRDADRVVQVGMQRRSYDLFLQARDAAANGALGSVNMARSWWVDNVLRLSDKKLTGPIDWEQWQGPAPRRDQEPLRFFEWRRFTEYSGGPITDIGPHVMDGIHMLMGVAWPAAVNASAGPIRTKHVDTPETMVVAVEYPEGVMAVFTLNYGAMKYKPANDQLTQLDGDQARLDIGREQFAIYRRGQEDTPARSVRSEKGFQHAVRQHVQNFLDCVRTRRQPTAPVEIGFQAALIGQMANESLRLGRRVRWNSTARRVEP